MGGVWVEKKKWQLSASSSLWISGGPGSWRTRSATPGDSSRAEWEGSRPREDPSVLRVHGELVADSDIRKGAPKAGLGAHHKHPTC